MVAKPAFDTNAWIATLLVNLHLLKEEGCMALFLAPSTPSGHFKSTLRKTLFGDTDVADPMDSLEVREVFDIMRPWSNSRSPVGCGNFRR